MSRAVLSLGSNLGDRLGYLRLAVDGLRDVLVAVSGVYETAPWGVEDQPDFLNAVCVVDDPARDHWAWLRKGQELERQAERVREQRWGPRTLDVDVVQYGTLVASAPDLELPHPRARERAFVLVPWAEVAPDAVLHGLGGGPVAQLAATAPDRSGIRWLALDWLTGPQDTVAAPRAAHGPATSGTGPTAPATHEPVDEPEPVRGPVPEPEPVNEPVHEPVHEPVPPPPESAFAPPSYHPPHAGDRDR